jgi:hypothetical protein
LSIVYISIKLQRFGSWIFFRLQVKKEGQKPQLLGPLVELASDLDQGLRLDHPGGLTARVSVLHFLPEDGRRSSFRNVVILLKYRRWTKSKKEKLLQI